MADVEKLFATTVNDQVKFYYTYDDRNNRLLTCRATNDSAQECWFEIEYQGQVFRDGVGGGEEKTWDIRAQWGNVDVAQVILRTES